MLEEKVELTDDSVWPFSTVASLITQEVDLPWRCLTHHSKHSTLPWRKKINWAWLDGVAGVMHLLGIIEAVVGLDGDRVGLVIRGERGGENSSAVVKNSLTDS